jgi:tetratricopeptide (TPR) repeat protein
MLSMKRFSFVSAMLAVVLLSRAAWAEDDIYVRGKEKPVKGVVTTESAKGISAKGAGTIAAETIDDIVYEVTPVQTRIAMYRPATIFEKESLDPSKESKRKANIAEALKKFQDAAAKVEQPFAKRHCEYKVAVLLARQASEDGAPAEPAIEALTKFKSNHADSWQIGACLTLLGRLQLEAKDFTGAKATYAELAQANVPEDVKQEAQLQVIQVSVREGKMAEAKAALDGFIKNTPPGGKQAVKARVVQGELQVHAKDYDGALKILTQAAKETSDRELKALIYNAKGVCLFEKADFKGARWEFLWVDVVYNQSKAEHAKALYYLAKVFEQIGDPEKSQECREQLLNDRAFAGSEWRARAQKESKAN